MRRVSAGSGSRRGARGALTLLAALLLLTGCGGGGGAAAGGGGGSGPAEIKLIVGPVAFEAPYIAQEQGFFAEQQLEVQIEPGGTADAQIPRLLNGEAQIAMTGGVAMVNAASKNLPVSITLGALNAVPPVTSGLVVPDDSPIRSTADLGGKKVGLAGLKDTTQLGTMLSAEERGVDPDSITFVEVPLPAMAEAMEKGTVDAAYVIGPFFRVGEGTGFRLVESSALEHLTNGPNVVFAASNRYLEDNREVVKRFNAAIAKAVEFANANPDAVRKVDARYSEQPEEYIKTRPLPPLATEVDTGALQATVDAMAKYGFIDTKPEIGQIVSDVCPTT